MGQWMHLCIYWYPSIYPVAFVNDVFPDGHRLMADNDPKHTSKAAQEFLVDKEIVEAIFINY